MTFELWNTRTRNLVASFADETAALSFVRDALRDHGVDYVARLALAREGEDGRSETVASGQALVERALNEQSLPIARPAAARPA
jgi:hypothetical protein